MYALEVRALALDNREPAESGEGAVLVQDATRVVREGPGAGH